MNFGQSLISIEKVDNGWIVTVNTSLRDKEESIETLAKKEEQKLIGRTKTKEMAKRSLEKMLSLQGELSELVSGESWSDDREEKIDRVVEAMLPSEEDVSSGVVSPTGLMGLNLVLPPNPMKTRVFTDRAEMIGWVTEMLNPEII